MNLGKLLDYLRQHLRAVVWASLAILALLIVIDLIPGAIDKHHAHTAIERFPGFWAVFGFFGCLLIFAFSKAFGHLGISTREDYYDD